MAWRKLGEKEKVVEGRKKLLSRDGRGAMMAEEVLVMSRVDCVGF